MNELESEKLKKTYQTIEYGLKKIYENKKLQLSNGISNGNVVNNTENQNTSNGTTEEN